MMTEAEILQGLGALDEQHRFWKAVQAELANAVEAETQAVTLPLLTDAARQFNAGRLAMARDIQQSLKDSVAKAHQEQAKA